LQITGYLTDSDDDLQRALYTGYLALNGNKIKTLYTSTIKCTGEIDKFSNTALPKVSYVLSRYQYDTIRGTRYIKMIFCFLLGIGKHFIGNTHCICNICHATHSHFVLFHDKQSIYKPPKEKSRR
jgi:hypothetical protein